MLRNVHQHTSSGTGPVDSTVNEGDHIHDPVRADAVIEFTNHLLADLPVHKLWHSENIRTNRIVMSPMLISTHIEAISGDSWQDGVDALKRNHGAIR